MAGHYCRGRRANLDQLDRACHRGVLGLSRIPVGEEMTEYSESFRRAPFTITVKVRFILPIAARYMAGVGSIEIPLGNGRRE